MTSPAVQRDYNRRCINFGLCGVNLLLVLVCLNDIWFGRTIYDLQGSVSYILDTKYFFPGTVVVIFGGFILTTAFIGCYSAFKKNSCALCIYIFFVSTILVIGIWASVAAFALQNEFVGHLNEKFHHTMHKYNYDNSTREAVDSFQWQLRCCGYEGPEDWVGILKNNSTRYMVPKSCCDGMYIDTKGCLDTFAFSEGCKTKVAHVMYYTTLTLLIGSITMAFIEINAITLAIILGRIIREEQMKQGAVLRERISRSTQENLPIEYKPLERKEPFSATCVEYVQKNYEKAY